MRLPWLLLTLALATAAGLYYYPDSARELSRRFGHDFNAPATAHLYKWKNAAGAWQITDQPPPPGTAYEQLSYRSDVNVLPVPPGITPAR